MCGIAVVFHRNPSSARNACEKAVGALVHRGPDCGGLLEIPTNMGSLFLGHRRLAILDLTPSGAQPMVDDTTGNAIVFNGEIYNFRSLRKELENAGKRFRGTSDTEVLLLGYGHWGTDLFDKLRGMFALAIWDAREKQLVLARDHAGMKPLYWHQSDEHFVLASETQAIVKTNLFSPRINRRGLTSFLAYGSVLEPDSIIEGISMLEAGCWASLKLDHTFAPPKHHVYWKLPNGLDHSSTFDFAAGLRNSVLGHLESDVPVGVFLSGGVDSTAIAETVSKLGDRDVRTFTIGFNDDSSIDETSIAEETARQLKTIHESVFITEQIARQNVENWLTCLDQPSLDGLNTYLVTKAARGIGLKVALSGLGGDELFGGYRSFRKIPSLMRMARPLRLIPSPLRQMLVSTMMLGQSTSRRGRALDYAKNISSLEHILFASRRLFSDSELNSLCRINSNKLRESVMPALRRIPKVVNQAEDIPAAIAAFEACFYMKDTLLRDSDISGMAHGFEIRLPLLDRDLMEAAIRMPQNLRMGDRTINKPVLVGAAGPRTKEVSKLKKRGFSLPYARWIRGPLLELFEQGIESAIQRGVVERKPAIGLFESFRAGNTDDKDWSRIWALGVLGNWLNRMELKA
jgi:asparagine synthase (glutamine-hydrolysing)